MRTVLYTVGFVAGLLLFGVQAWVGYQSYREHQHCLVRPAYLFGALVLYVMAYFAQMGAWAVIMRFLQAPLAPRHVVGVYMLSFLPRYIPGTVWGYLSRNEWLAQIYRVPYATSTVSSLLEVTSLLLAAFSVSAIYVVDDRWKVATAAGCVILLWLNWRLLPEIAGRVGRNRFRAEPVRQNWLWLWLLGNILYVVFWTIHGAAILITSRALCGDASIDLATAVFAASMSWAIGLLVVFVPAGLGVRELTLASLLSRHAGVPTGQANMIAVISRVVLIVAELMVLLLGSHFHLQTWWGKRERAAKLRSQE